MIVHTQLLAKILRPNETTLEIWSYLCADPYQVKNNGHLYKGEITVQGVKLEKGLAAPLR